MPLVGASGAVGLGVKALHFGLDADHLLMCGLHRAVQLGPAGVEVPLMLARGGEVLRIAVKSADRDDFLKKPKLH